MSLEETHNQEPAVIGRVQDSQLLIQVPSVGLFAVLIAVEADGIKTALVNDNIKAVRLVASVQEVFDFISDTFHAPFLHLLDHFGNKVIARDFGLGHHSDELF